MQNKKRRACLVRLFFCYNNKNRLKGRFIDNILSYMLYCKQMLFR